MAGMKLLGGGIENAAFLGAEVKDNNKPKLGLIDSTADKLHTKNILSPTTPLEITNQNAMAENTILALNGGASRVDALILRADPNSTTLPAEKLAAEEALDILAKSTYIVMRYGGDLRLVNALNTPGDIDLALPEPMRGLGERIIANFIRNEDVLNQLRNLDKFRKRANQMSDVQANVFMAEVLDDALRVLGKLDVPDADEDELNLALAYIGTIRLDIETDDVADKIIGYMTEKDELVEIQQKERAAAEQSAAVGGLENSRYNTFLAMMLHKNPIQLDVFQQYAPEWMRQEADKPLMQTLVALANACHFKWRYGDSNLDVMTDTRGEAVFNATNEMMQNMYEIPGVRETMEYFVEEFFVGARENGVFVLRLRNESGIVDRIQNIGNELNGQVEVLTRNGLRHSDAMLAVSTAFNLLYVGHVFEDADPDRKMKPCDAYVEQMRAFMYPARKARSKQLGEPDVVGSEEGWGGQLGQWLTEVVMRGKRKEGEGIGVEDPDVAFMHSYQAGEIHPFPARLFASFFVLTEVNVRDDDGALIMEPSPTERNVDRMVPAKMNLAEALFTKTEIDFIEAGAGGNPWGGYYDVSTSAGMLYKIVKGDKKAAPLPLGDPRAVQDIAGWAHEVSDARKKAKGQDILKRYVADREFVKWIIAACTVGGLYQHSAELVLMTPDVAADQDVSFDGLLKRRDLVDSEADKIWIKKEFHANGAMSRVDRSRIRSGISKNSLSGKIGSLLSN
jgi:hypothetical protein